jgi:hypothetical protein
LDRERGCFLREQGLGKQDDAKNPKSPRSPSVNREEYLSVV